MRSQSRVVVVVCLVAGLAALAALRWLETSCPS
jgi:hypothetical protein